MHSIIQQAGFTPCLPIGALQTLNPSQHQSLQALAIDPLDPSVITTHRMGDGFVTVSSIMNPYQLFTAGSATLQGPLLIADCHHAEVIAGFIQQGTTLNLKHPLAFQYYPPMYIGEWETVAFGLKTQRLYYYHKHRETLLTDVRSLIWTINSGLGRLLVHAEMQLEQTPAYSIDIRLRNPA